MSVFKAAGLGRPVLTFSVSTKAVTSEDSKQKEENCDTVLDSRSFKTFLLLAVELSLPGALPWALRRFGAGLNQPTDCVPVSEEGNDGVTYHSPDLQAWTRSQEPLLHEPNRAEVRCSGAEGRVMGWRRGSEVEGRISDILLAAIAVFHTLWGQPGGGQVDFLVGVFLLRAI